MELGSVILEFNTDGESPQEARINALSFVIGRFAWFALKEFSNPLWVLATLVVWLYFEMQTYLYMYTCTSKAWSVEYPQLLKVGPDYCLAAIYRWNGREIPSQHKSTWMSDGRYRYNVVAAFPKASPSVPKTLFWDCFGICLGTLSSH